MIIKGYLEYSKGGNNMFFKQTYSHKDQNNENIILYNTENEAFTLSSFDYEIYEKFDTCNSIQDNCYSIYQKYMDTLSYQEMIDTYNALIIQWLRSGLIEKI